MKIITKIEEWDSILPYVSFEYFPPKTEAGVENL
jgi:5,10-methylenetetrahydrofolate reductase